MLKVAFITGITGQDGSYLAELLLQKKYKVYGIVRRTSLLYSHTRLDSIRHQLHLQYGDLTDSSGLSTFLHSILNENNIEVFEIYNLAAQSHVGISFDLPEYTSDVDGLGVLRLLEIIKNFPEDVRSKIKFYQAGTSELYGKVLEVPQNENTPFNPVSPYAASKLYSYQITKMYRDAYKLFAVNGILFNHESPRRGANFVTMKIIQGIKKILDKEMDCIELGNLDAQRDWGHARDYVYGMYLMMQQDTPKDYVLSTGKTMSVRKFVELAFSQKGITIGWKGENLNEIGFDIKTGKTLVRINPRFFRPCEVDLLLGDCSKAEKELGWTRKFDTVEKLIEDMFSA